MNKVETLPITNVGVASNQVLSLFSSLPQPHFGRTSCLQDLDDAVSAGAPSDVGCREVKQDHPRTFRRS